MKTSSEQLDANPSSYLADSGNTSTGVGNPAMGSMFAFLALKYIRFFLETILLIILLVSTPDLAIKFPPSSTKSTVSPPIVGGVLGGLGALILISISAYFLFRQRKLRKGTTTPEHEYRPAIDSERNAATQTFAPSINEFNPYELPEVTMAPAELPLTSSNSPPPYANDHTSFNNGKVLLAPNLNSFATVRGGDQNESRHSEQNGT